MVPSFLTPAIIHWSLLEFILAALAVILLVPVGDMFAAFLDNQILRYYQKWFKK